MAVVMRGCSVKFLIFFGVIVFATFIFLVFLLYFPNISFTLLSNIHVINYFLYIDVIRSSLLIFTHGVCLSNPSYLVALTVEFVYLWITQLVHVDTSNTSFRSKRTSVWVFKLDLA